jgi:Subtilase family
MNITNSSIKKLPNTGFAEKLEASPKLALLDDFDGDPNGFPHGQAVESVLFSHSELTDTDVQRVQNTPKQADLTKLMRQDGLDFRTAFHTMVARNIAHFYLGTAQNLQNILQQQPNVQIVSQSQGETPGRHLELLFNGLQKNPDFKQGACQSYGLAPNAPLSEICEALLRDADKVAAENEICQKARKEHEKASKALHDRGITYMVASGNHGPIGDALKSIGVEASPSAFRNILVNDYVTVVGGTTPEGQPSPFNSPGAAIEVLRRGEDLAWSAAEGFDQSGVATGSSFATPIAAGEALEFLASHPGKGPFEVESYLMGLDSYRVTASQSEFTANGQELNGDGQLESYIQDKIGAGFITDVSSPDATQIAQASQDRAFFGLPGQKDHEFQLIKMRLDTDGNRQLNIDTYFDEGHHVLQATAKDGAWDPHSVIEELHLDSKRQREIEQREAGTEAQD